MIILISIILNQTNKVVCLVTMSVVLFLAVSMVERGSCKAGESGEVGNRRE